MESRDYHVQFDAESHSWCVVEVCRDSLFQLRYVAVTEDLPSYSEAQQALALFQGR